MPWKECHVMDERLRFVARLLEGEKMAPLCAEFGISRKTGYKISTATRTAGSRPSAIGPDRPHRQANRLPAPMEATIVRLKRENPGWGAPKIREKLRRSSPARTCRPSARSMRCSTVTPWCTTAPAAAARDGTALSRPTNRMPSGAPTTKASSCSAIALLLSADDHRLRQSLSADVRGADDHAEKFAFTVFERTFKEFGLPQVIRTDNGVPFASAHAHLWPEQAGRVVVASRDSDRTHQAGPPATERPARADAPDAEREATKPAAANVLQQQARLMTSSRATITSARIRRSA